MILIEEGDMMEINSIDDEKFIVKSFLVKVEKCKFFFKEYIDEEGVRYVLVCLRFFIILFCYYWNFWKVVYYYF